MTTQPHTHQLRITRDGPPRRPGPYFVVYGAQRARAWGSSRVRWKLEWRLKRVGKRAVGRHDRAADRSERRVKRLAKEALDKQALIAEMSQELKSFRSKRGRPSRVDRVHGQVKS